MEPHTDPWAIDGKFPSPDEHAGLLVIGGGPAGLLAATEAARLGVKVVLVDENPVPLSLIGIDVPLFYGQRMNAAVQEEARMIERLVASDPMIEAAFDAGVDVRLGVAAWGAFCNGPALGSLPARVVGLTDGKRSWTCGFEALILATGARDLVLGFPGIDLPGVMGAQGLHSLLQRYDAFEGKRLVVVGSGMLAVGAALAARERGLEVAALIEILPVPRADAAALAELAARGVPILTGTVLLRAEPGMAGVEAAIVSCDGVEQRLECDTVCLAIGAVPVIELAGVLGCRLAYRGELGGHVPLTAADGLTSLPGVFCVGDAAGLRTHAAWQAQARAAAGAVAALLGEGSSPALAAECLDGGIDPGTDYRLAWMRALAAVGDRDAPACLCEEVSRSELLGMRPPRYLGCGSERQAVRDSASLLRDGPLHPDQIKRLTRAGMGPCQGRRCREQIALLLALEQSRSPAEIPLASYRAPVRPLALSVLADDAETATMKAGWDVWFGIRTQWVPYGIIGTAAEGAFLDAGSGGNMHA